LRVIAGVEVGSIEAPAGRTSLRPKWTQFVNGVKLTSTVVCTSTGKPFSNVGLYVHNTDRRRTRVISEKFEDHLIRNRCEVEEVETSFEPTDSSLRHEPRRHTSTISGRNRVLVPPW